MEGGRTLHHKDCCTGNEDNSMYKVLCTVCMALNIASYTYHGGIYERMNGHKEGKAHSILLCNGASKRENDCKASGKFRVNSFPDNRHMSQNTDDHMAALFHMLQGNLHLPGSDSNAFQSCDHIVAFWSQVHCKDT